MSKKRNIGLWVSCLALQCLLCFGLILFWVYERDSLRDPLPRASDETVQLQLKNVKEQEARGVITGQQVRIKNLLYARETAHTFTGYMAGLSVASVAITLLLMGLSLTRDRKPAAEPESDPAPE